MNSLTDFFSPGHFAPFVAAILSGRTAAERLREFFARPDMCPSLVEPFSREGSLHRFISGVAFQELKTRLAEIYARAQEGNRSGLAALDELLHSYDLAPAGPDAFFSARGLKPADADVTEVCAYLRQLRAGGAPDELCDRIADVVHPRLFAERTVLRVFNELAAAEVAQLGQADFRLYGRPLAADGRLREKPVPRWVRRAVFARERGRCVRCDRPVSDGLLVPFVPLSAGGINDVTNLELRCPCCAPRAGNGRQAHGPFRHPRLRLDAE